eukprot:gene9065-11103_t
MRISPSESYFIQQGVESNIRSDGRTRLDYRYFTLETGEIVHANGSARLKLGETEVLVGVKADISKIEPNDNLGNRKYLTFTVDCCPSASPEFEGKGSEYINVELAKQLERLYSHQKSIDFEQLSILPGKYCWTLYIDAIVLDSGGNLFDALSIATKAALFNTRLPKIKVTQGEYEEIKFEVNEDPLDTLSLSIDNVPISVTLTKIGTQFIIDSTLQEELCMDARLTIGVNSKSNICSIQKGGDQGIDPILINQMINTAKHVGTKILASMDNILKNDDNKMSS